MLISPVITSGLSEYETTAYVVGFGDGVRSWVTGEGGEDVALEEARSWHADQAYIDGWRNGREWAKGRRG